MQNWASVGQNWAVCAELGQWARTGPFVQNWASVGQNWAVVQNWTERAELGRLCRTVQNWAARLRSAELGSAFVVSGQRVCILC